MRNQDLFAGDYNIDTPESVAFDYTIADVGTRFLAAFVDIIIVGLALAGLNGLIFWVLRDTGGFSFEGEATSWVAGLLVALYAVLNFVIFWGYFMLLELKWNGQTVGKRIVGIRVVRVDGSPAGALEIAVRNLVRIIDFMPSGYLLGLAAMLLTPQARRLGDLAGGTLVVKADAPITLEHLVQAAMNSSAARPSPALSLDAATESGAQAATRDVPGNLSYNLRALRSTDYALIQDALARDARAPLADALLVRLATAIAEKIAYVGQDVAAHPRAFLIEVAEAYRRKG